MFASTYKEAIVALRFLCIHPHHSGESHACPKDLKMVSGIAVAMLVG